MGISSSPKKKSKLSCITEDEEIYSDGSDIEGRNDVGYQSDPEVDAETAEEKRVRLAETYLQEIIRQEKNLGRQDDEKQINSLINKRLKKDDDEEKGKLRLEMADKLLQVNVDRDLKILRDGKNHSKSLTCVAVHDPWIFTGSKDAGITKWDLKLGTKLHRIKGGHRQGIKKGDLEYPGHLSSVNAIAISSDSKFMVSLSWVLSTYRD